MPLSEIRNLYAPIQPTINQSTEDIVYTELIPHDNLQNYIYCYWQLKTNKQLTMPFNYRVVADGCIDIFFELTQPQESYVMGFCRKFVEFPLGQSFNYIGIRFLPTIFTQLFRVNASEICNRFENLHVVAPNIAGFIANHIQTIFQIDQISAVFDNYFSNLISNTLLYEDNRLYDAIEIILKKYGIVNIEKDLQTGISQRQLRRLFEYYIGATPKTFAKVVRFQNILRAKPSIQSLRQNKLFYSSGYYDQAHFIKEFRDFYGVTPSKAFGR